VSDQVAEAKNGTVGSPQIKEKRRSQKQADRLPQARVLPAQAKGRTQEAAGLPAPTRKPTAAAAKIKSPKKPAFRKKP